MIHITIFYRNVDTRLDAAVATETELQNLVFAVGRGSTAMIKLSNRRSADNSHYVVPAEIRSIHAP